jgi:cellulose synthase/poly-beta-1,6-N-acetylglucosamine synthase-like glycosyltransferase
LVSDDQAGDEEIEEIEEIFFDDADGPEPAPLPVHMPPPRRRRGGVIGAGLLGLEAALYGPRQNEIVMVADADGMPEPDFDVQLTPDPRDSVVTIRRRFWRKRD